MRTSYAVSHPDLPLLTHSFPPRRSSALCGPPIVLSTVIRLRPRQSSRPPCASIAMSSRSLILTSPFSYLHLDYDHTINCQAPSRAESPRTDRSCFGHCHLLDYDYHLSGRRSEEHTSELQSLMRISYAVFCF